MFTYYCVAWLRSLGMSICSLNCTLWQNAIQGKKTKWPNFHKIASLSDDNLKKCGMTLNAVLLVIQWMQEVHFYYLLISLAIIVLTPGGSRNTRVPFLKLP